MLNKAEFIADIQATRAAFITQLNRFGNDEMHTAVINGDLSPHQLLAHVVWYEREMIALLTGRTLVDASPWWMLTHIERNAKINAQAAAIDTATLRLNAEGVFGALIEQLSALPEPLLDDPAGFDGMPEEWSPRELITGSTNRHYREHTADIIAWFAAK